MTSATSLAGVAQFSRSNSAGETLTPTSLESATISSTVFIESRICRSYSARSGFVRTSSVSATLARTSRILSEFSDIKRGRSVELRDAAVKEVVERLVVIKPPGGTKVIEEIDEKGWVFLVFVEIDEREFVLRGEADE